MAFNPAQGTTYNLGASIGSTDTSILLSSFSEPVSGTLYTMAYFNSAIMFGTIAPTTSSAELISFTGITQNANGTATLTGVSRGLQKAYPYTASATFQLPHAGQSIFILSDAPQVFNEYANLVNDQTFTGLITFTQPPIGINPGGQPNASSTVIGVTKLSVDPVSSINPIAVGQNDPLVSPVSLASLTAGEVSALAGTSGTPGSGNKYVTNADTQGSGSIVRTGVALFGGTGADGALNDTSGTNTLSLANAALVVKNYTSINISGGATRNFSNPNTNGTIIVLKSQGNVTIAGTLDASGMGGAGGAGGASGSANGTAGSSGSGVLDSIAHAGAGGVGNETGGAGGGAAGTVIPMSYTAPNGHQYRRTYLVFSGSGGGGGGAGNGANFGAGGAGGAGGGAIIIECGGALNFTGTIKTSGLVGTAGSANSGGTNNGGGGGGGGGSAGMLVILYTTLTANSGTITTAGGAGADAGQGNGTGNGGAGGGGATSYVAGGGGGGGSASGSTGVNGNSGGVGGGGGGGGASGSASPGTAGSAGAADSNLSYIAINTDFI